MVLAAVSKRPEARGGAVPVDTPARANLRRLAWLRLVALLVLLGAAWGVRSQLGAPLALATLAATGGAVCALSLLTLWRCARSWPVRDYELGTQLALDVLALTVVFHASSGAANPFVSLYLVPLVVAAATLPRLQVWALSILACAGYTLLMLDYGPMLSHHHGGAPAEFDLHVVGMWGNFVLSAGIIGVAVVNMGAALRERDAHLAQARESMLRTEQILGLATLAAGAAHELGTPLSTMAVLSRELELECEGRPALQEDLRLLRSQVGLCKDIIQRMLARNPAAEGAPGQVLELHDFLRQVTDTWRLMRPRTQLEYSNGVPPAGCLVREDATLSQALINVLNNAADASPEGIEVRSRIEGLRLTLEVLDRGAGVDSATAQQLGRAWFTTKAGGRGLGLGLFLTNATLERLGGTVRLVNRAGAGACTTIELPLDAIAAGGA